MVKKIFLYVCLFSLIILVGCRIGRQPETWPVINSSPTVRSTLVETLRVPVEMPVATPTMEKRSLVICMDGEPDTLYPIFRGSQVAQSAVLEAIFDGPIDNRSYSYQSVILEKLPDLAEGDAVLQTVEVQAGDLVVDVNGDVVALQAGVRVFPSGCRLPECSVVYDGTDVIAMDQLAVTFQLLPNLKWSDGVPLTADDSVYAYRLAADPGTPNVGGIKTKIERTATYEALDERSIRWTGLPGFLDQTYFLNFWSPLPEHAWSQYTARELLEEEASRVSPIGWGPYVIQTWKFGEYIQLRKNPHYFRAVEGLPRFDKLIYRFVPEDARNSIDLLLSGKCDILGQEIALYEEIEFLLQLESEGKIQAEFAANPAWEHVAFAVQPAETWQGFSATGAFRDPRLRQAIALCMDRQRVVDEVFFGQSVVMDTFLPPEHPLSKPDVHRYAFDPQAGSAMLEEIGWTDHDRDPATPRIYQGDDVDIPQGTPLEFNYWTTKFSNRPEIAQILAESLTQCGVKVNVESRSAEELYAANPDGPLFGRQFDVVQFASLSGTRPTCEFLLQEQIPGDPAILDASGQPLHPLGWNGSNVTGYSDPEYEGSCKAALSTLPGEPGYRENYGKVQEIFARDLPLIPLYPHLKVAAARPDLCGFILDPTTVSEMWNIEAFDYGDDCMSNSRQPADSPW